MADIKGVSEEILDMLREVGNIGASNAITALSALLGHGIEVNVSKAFVQEIESFMAILGEENDIVASVVEIYEGLNGLLLLALEEESALKIVNHVLDKRLDSTIAFNEMDHSFISEVGNILAGSYTNTLSELVDTEITLTVPQMSIDMASSIMSSMLIDYTQDQGSMTMIKTNFNDNEDMLKGTYILVLESDSFEKLIESLREML